MISTVTSKFKQVPCPANCELCKSGAGHISIGEIPTAPVSASEGGAIPDRTSHDGYREKEFGAHVREVVEIIREWRRSK